MIFCMTLSDWFTLYGAISSTAGIIVALFIASYQERKNRKRMVYQCRLSARVWATKTRVQHAYILPH